MWCLAKQALLLRMVGLLLLNRRKGEWPQWNTGNFSMCCSQPLPCKDPEGPFASKSVARDSESLEENPLLLLYK